MPRTTSALSTSAPRKECFSEGALARVRWKCFSLGAPVCGHLSSLSFCQGMLLCSLQGYCRQLHLLQEKVSAVVFTLRMLSVNFIHLRDTVSRCVYFRDVVSHLYLSRGRYLSVANPTSNAWIMFLGMCNTCLYTALGLLLTNESCLEMPWSRFRFLSNSLIMLLGMCNTFLYTALGLL
jgi:hypothetical protein